ncbi:extracellular signal-regulated kinase 2-like [Planococcus citri]|uniref:extracellular signal-regulated kinase 2-like n=1 Tax=Planococcus citri TaxID=170843 RepID=UPI0031F89124
MDKNMELDSHVLDRYIVKRRIGKGAYGIVWRAIDKKSKTEVALKKIFDAFQNKTDAQRTYREIFYLQRFSEHPNIVRLFHIHRALNCNDIYLVFEYMEVDLHKVIRKGNILKDIHNRYIIYQILKAIAYIHSANVIHRDLKPANILLNSECVCKVADFGLARSVQEQNSSYGERYDPSLTDYIATRWYRAPEILVASKMYQKGVDMWSIGCILAELLLGRPLFPGSSTINQIELIMSTVPPKSKADIKAISTGYGKSLLEKFTFVKSHTLNKKLRHVDEDAYDLLSKLLVFNPLHRITSTMALEHPYVNIFLNKQDIIPISPVTPAVRDDTQLTVDEYRQKLYDAISFNEFTTKRINSYIQKSCNLVKRSAIQNSFTTKSYKSSAKSTETLLKRQLIKSSFPPSQRVF